MLLARLLISLALCSPQTPDTLDAVKVSSSRKADAVATAPVRSMGAQGIARMGAAGLQDVLRTFTGISIKDYGGVGGLKTVQVRSLGAQHTAVSYDGMSISDACNGQVDLSRFSIEGLSEVTMEIGASDDIYSPARSFGAAGMLSLTSLMPSFEHGKTALSARMRFASFGTYNPYIGISRKLGDSWAASLEGDFLHSEGSYPFTLVNGKEVTREKRLGSDVGSLNAEARIYGELPHGGRLEGKLRCYGSRRGLPGAVIYYTQNPTERLWDRDISSNISYRRSWNSGWKLKAGASYSNMWNRYLNTSAFYQTPEEDIYRQQEGSASAVAGRSIGSRVNISLAEDLVYNTLWSNIPECQFPQRISSYTALRGQYKGERLTLTAGLGGLLMHEWVQNGEAAPDRARLSPSASVSWMFAEGFRLRASVRDGFRLPTFNDLYYARVGNRSLNPEKALLSNLGLTWDGSIPYGRITVTADGYWNRVKDKIVAVPTMFIWKMRNLGLVQMLGSDLTVSASARPGRIGMHLDAGWSYQYAVDVSDPEAKNYRHQIQYTPRNSGNLTAGVDTPWVDVCYMLSAVGARYFMPQNIDDNRLPAYADHSVTLRRQFALRGARLTASAEALNLAGVNYEIVQGYPMPGRSFRLSIKITY